MAVRYRRGDNLTLVIHSNMQFLPALTRLLPVLLDMPFALAAHFQAAAVNDQGYPSLGRMLDLLSNRHRGAAAREWRMIRAGQRHVHQRQEGTEKAFRLPQGQAKEQPERERRL